MANINHTPIDKESLKALSSSTLTALSNHFSEKASSVQARLSNLENQISVSETRQSSVSETNKSTGPVVSEINTFKSAVDSGVGASELFDRAAPSKALPDIITDVMSQLDEGSVTDSDMAEANNRRLFELQSERGIATTTLQLINNDIDKLITVLEERISNPELEPSINYDILETSAIGVALSQKDIDRIAEHKDFVNNKLITPLKDSKAAVTAFRLQLTNKTPQDDSPQFDLVYGPPVSTKGRYILSEDGLYYDSRSGGLPDSTVNQILFNTWNLEFAPNKGGKGIHYDDFNLKEYSNTIFSEEFTETNDTVLKLYDIDSILQGIEDDKVSHVNIVSGQITDLIVSGYDSSSAMVTNYKRSIAAIANSYSKEANKRKKQLQLAGLYGDFVITTNDFPMGENHLLKPIEGDRATPFAEGAKDGWTLVGDIAILSENGAVIVFDILKNIPINDFSFLNTAGINPTIDVQNRTLLQSADVNDIIKPYKVKYTKSAQEGSIFLKDFTTSPLGTGDFTHIEGDKDVSSVKPFVKSLNDGIVTDNLVVCYNFLKGVVESPSSTSYLLDNEAEGSTTLNGKLVATSVSAVFPSGVSIPYLGGTLYDPELSESPEPWYSNVPKGSYVRLPNNIRNGSLYRGSSRIDDLTYNSAGFSVDTWLHVPDLVSGLSESHQYRLLLSCENTGKGGDLTARVNSNDTGILEKDLMKVHGMCVGFRLKDEYVSGTPEVSSLEFGIFPTVSQNNDDGKWGPSVTIGESISGLDAVTATKQKLGFYFDASSVAGVTTSSLLDCSGAFMHLAILFNYKKDTVSVYLDKELISSAAISTSFDTNPGSPLQIPSPATYQENNPYIGSHGMGTDDVYVESLHEGTTLPPEGVQALTPWIIGGGFTDSVRRSQKLESLVGATSPLGFMGSNTNSSYFTSSLDVSGAVTGQHSPSIGGALYSGVSREIPRSGLDGFVGSFKIYSKPLDIKEISLNFDSQQAFFKNIQV